MRLILTLLMCLTSIVMADKEYERATKVLETKYKAALVKVANEYLQRLEDGKTLAMKSGNLKAANDFDSKIKKLRAKFEVRRPKLDELYDKPKTLVKVKEPVSIYGTYINTTRNIGYILYKDNTIASTKLQPDGTWQIRGRGRLLKNDQKYSFQFNPANEGYGIEFQLVKGKYVLINSFLRIDFQQTEGS